MRLRNVPGAKMCIRDRYKNVYVWKYKVVNGNLYKRKYNRVTGEWVGKWMPV